MFTKKKYLFISIQILGLTYDLIINCNTILWAALYVGNIFISYNRPANFCQSYSICPYMGKIPIKSMGVYCLRVIKFIRKGLVVKAPVCDLGNQTDFQVPPQTSRCVLRRVIYPLKTCSPPKASVINNISLLQWEVGRTHRSCSARVEVLPQQAAPKHGLGKGDACANQPSARDALLPFCSQEEAQQKHLLAIKSALSGRPPDVFQT